MVWLVQREQMSGRLLNVSGMVQTVGLTLDIVYVRNEDQNLHRTSEQSTRKGSLKTFLQNEELCQFFFFKSSVFNQACNAILALSALLVSFAA